MKRVLLAVIAAALAVASVFLCVNGIRRKQDPPVMRRTASGIAPAEVTAVARPDGTVDINSDDIDDLTMLRGIGESLAARIIEERLANGSYHYPEDLYTVAGIGANKVDGFRDQLDFSWEIP